MPRTPAWLMMVELLGDAVGRADERIAADRVGGEVTALGLVFLGRHGLRRHALVGQHAVDRAPVGIVDDGVLVVVVGFFLRRAADHLADGEDFDVAAERGGGGLDLIDLDRAAFERFARTRGRDEKRVAVAQRESLPDIGRAGIHQKRPRRRRKASDRRGRL